MKISEFLNTGTVLVLEPSENYRATVKRYLANLKVKSVKFFEKVSEVKTEMAVSQISLLIIEWKLKDMQNGLQFSREVRKEARFRDTPLMLLSVESLRGDVVLASEVGIDAYMLKPFSYEDFVDQLHALIKKSADRIRFSTLMDEADKKIDAREFEEAEKILSECKSHDVNSARVQCGLGRIQHAQGNDRAALAFYHAAIEANPNYLESYRYTLEILLEKDEPHRTLHFALRAHELSPDNPHYMLQIAKAYLQINELKESEKFFRMTIRISPTLAEGHKGLGDVHMMQEEYDKAMLQYQKALDLDGDDVSILNSIGLVYIKQDQYEQGIRQYLLALQVDGSNAKVLFNLGHAYEKIEEFEKAKSYYNKSLISEPDYDKPARGLQRLQKVKSAS